MNIKRLFLLSLFLNPFSLFGAANQYLDVPPITSRRVNGDPSTIPMATLDAGGESYGSVFQFPHVAPGAQLVKAHWRTATVTTGADMTVGFYTIFSTNGVPNTEDPIVTVTHTIDAGQDSMHVISTFTATTVTAGSTVAFIITNSVSAPGSMAINGLSDDETNLPYSVTNIGTGWTKGLTNITLGLEYSDGSFYHVQGLLPLKVINSNTFNNSSTLDERGNWLTMPFSARSVGAWVWMDQDGDGQLVLYDTDGVTELANLGFVNAARALTGSQVSLFTWPEPVDLTAGKKYRLVIRPTSVTNVTTYDLVLPSATARGGTPFGEHAGATHAKNPTGNASWVDTSTMTAFMGLRIDKVYTDRGFTFSQ